MYGLYTYNDSRYDRFPNAKAIGPCNPLELRFLQAETNYPQLKLFFKAKIKFCFAKKGKDLQGLDMMIVRIVVDASNTFPRE